MTILTRLESFRKKFIKNKFLFFMALAVMVWYAIFRYVPYYGNLIAFKDFSYAKGFWGSPWIGLGNFRALFVDQLFLRVLRNTLAVHRLLPAFEVFANEEEAVASFS